MELNFWSLQSREKTQKISLPSLLTFLRQLIKPETEKKWERGPFFFEKEVNWFLENKPDSLIYV